MLVSSAGLKLRMKCCVVACVSLCAGLRSSSSCRCRQTQATVQQMQVCWGQHAAMAPCDILSINLLCMRPASLSYTPRSRSRCADICQGSCSRPAGKQQQTQSLVLPAAPVCGIPVPSIPYEFMQLMRCLKLFCACHWCRCFPCPAAVARTCASHGDPDCQFAAGAPCAGGWAEQGHGVSGSAGSSGTHTPVQVGRRLRGTFNSLV